MTPETRQTMDMLAAAVAATMKQGLNALPPERTDRVRELIQLMSNAYPATLPGEEVEYLLALLSCLHAAIAEGLIADSEGRVIEGTMSNVFIAAGGRVFTPDLARCGVVGAQRERVRELLGGAKVHCEERDLRWTDVLAAEEIFLTNSLIGVWPVRQVDERQYSPGPIASRLRGMIELDDAAP